MFEVQRSADAKNWRQIGRVGAKGESQLKVDYEFVDKMPLSGSNYYRLRMVDNDSTFTYSRIADIQSDIPEVTMYPNPVGPDEQLKLQVGNGRVETITIFDQSGRLVYKASGAADSIATNRLTAGKYILKVRLTDGSESTHKLLKR